jgi:hypothetical protein
MLDDGGASSARESVPDEIVAITLVAQREEALTALHESGVVRATGESQDGIRTAAHDPPAARGEESFEREQRRRC